MRGRDLQHLYAKIIQAVRRRAAGGCAAHGGHENVRSLVCVMCELCGIINQSTMKDAKGAKIECDEEGFYQ